MTASSRPESAVEPSVEQVVLEYLREHPELLADHPELVAALEVPHAVGSAVSLVEHQVGVLRARNAELEHRIQRLVANARDNEELGQRVHRMTLELIACDGAGDVMAALYQSLVEQFNADYAVLRVFAEPREPADRGLAEFSAGAGGAEPFAGVLSAGKPTCGRLSTEHATILFGDDRHAIGSGALIPLSSGRPFGLLALGGRDPQRYHPGMGTVFLRQVAEIVSAVLRPHVRAT